MLLIFAVPVALLKLALKAFIAGSTALAAWLQFRGQRRVEEEKEADIQADTVTGFTSTSSTLTPNDPD